MHDSLTIQANSRMDPLDAAKVTPRRLPSPDIHYRQLSPSILLQPNNIPKHSALPEDSADVSESALDTALETYDSKIDVHVLDVNDARGIDTMTRFRRFY